MARHAADRDGHGGDGVTAAPLDAPVMRADILDGRRRLWRGAHRSLEITDRALRWETEEARAAVPWSAVISVDAVADDLTVVYRWPYAEDGTARVTFRLSPVSVFLVLEDVRRRLAIAELPQQRLSR